MKLLSLNVEQDKHLAKVREFIEIEKADIVALMEVYEDNLDTLLPNYPYRIFAPNFQQDGKMAGVVLASKTSIIDNEIFYVDEREREEVPEHGMGTHRPLLVVGKVGGVTFGATHFTWTPEMSETPKQHEHLDKLLEYLGERRIIMCGDFNIPRGNGAYAKLASKYRDNIPSDVKTTIDPNLHRANKLEAGKLLVVVDYIWTRGGFEVKRVEVKSGVSDHCGIDAEVS